MRRFLFACLLLISPFTASAHPWPEPGPIRCVPRCESRFLDGKCAQAGPDFCGPGAKCVARCESRFLDGRCSQWGPDFCGFERLP